MAKRRPSEDGMVRRRDDGRWEGRIVVGHKKDGSPIFRHILAPTQKELLDKLHQNIQLYQDVELTEDCRMTLAAWLDRWLEEFVAGTVRENTLSSHKNNVELYIKPQLGDKRISAITTEDVQKMYTKLKQSGRIREHPKYGHQLSDSMICHIHCTLHRALDDAVTAHLIPRNPTEGVVVPKQNYKSKQILTKAQLDAFLDTIQRYPIWYDFFYTELTTGLRRGEICGLQWRDFDPETGTLKIMRTLHEEKGGGLTTGETKTGKGKRQIVLPRSTAELLRERQKAALSEWIFPNPIKPELPMTPTSAYVKADLKL